jgi:deferrochelatase/peroxidase EfeB
MSDSNERSDSPRIISRRQALKGTSLAAVASLAAAGAGLEFASAASGERVAFHGVHQSGISTRVQKHLAFAAFDVASSSQAALRRVLEDWTRAASELVEGHELSGSSDPVYPAGDTGESADLGAAALSLTFGFGPSLFDHRFQLASKRPASLVELPVFPGDDLDPLRSGGDLCVQACADDPTVAFHAVRNLARLALGAVSLRYVQFGSGQTSTPRKGVTTPRNLLGFKDGTNNVRTDDAAAMAKHVWVPANSDQSWMTGGTYLVARRIRVHLEEWASLPLEDQQLAIGRFRASGAPLTGHRERDPLNFAKLDVFGAPVIAADAHVRVASAQANNGAVILRRGYNFADGVDPMTGELDAGLMFISFQRDPRRQFVTLQTSLASQDALSKYTTHTASAIFACPPGVARGEFIGQQLFD